MTKRHLALIRVSAVLVLICGLPSFAQVTTGTPAFAAIGGGPVDQINLANLNVHIPIPIMNKSGRGVPFTYSLSYDSSVWYPVASGSTQTWQAVPQWGWTSQSAVTTGYITYSELDYPCYGYDYYGNPSQDGNDAHRYNWVYHDQMGIPHPMDNDRDDWDVWGSSYYENCPSSGVNWYGTGSAMDGSGYSINYYVQIITPSGAILTPPLNTQGGSASFTDANGNQISVNGSGVFTDTLGQTALTVAGAGTQASPNTFQYAAPSGTAAYTMRYTNENIKTNFGCSGITEYSANNVPLVTEIDLPDQAVNTNDKYTFTYESTPSYSGYVTGRIASVTLPTGGTINYYYPGDSGYTGSLSTTNNGIECGDGSTAGFDRFTPDTGSSTHWDYARTISTTNNPNITLVTDPNGNQSNLQFQGIYLTEEQDYIGSTSGTLLKSLITCYNNNGDMSTCNTSMGPPPIQGTTSFFQWGGSGPVLATVSAYNTAGLLTEKLEFQYGGSYPVRKTFVNFANLGNGIVDKPSSVVVYDGSNNIVAQTTFAYDEYGLQSTSEPQHASVTGSRGNLTTVSTYVNSTTALTKHFTYFDTGNVYQATDVNNAVTTNTYGACNNSFPTQIAEPIGGMTQQMTWNCAGGVQLTATDENNKTVTTAYSDSYFWRPASVTDQLSSPNTTNFTYAGPISFEAAMNFNGSASTTDVLATTDSLGRLHISQLRNGQGSSTLDSVETDYDNLGRPKQSTQPYNGFVGSTCSGTCPVTVASYEALGRVSSVTDAGGGTVTTNYYENDVYQSAGPKPSSDANTKDKQLEYDGLGRLTSVCEITSGSTAWPSASCGQTHSATGYLTNYTYDLNNKLTGVTQNAQATSNQQTRSYTYDFLSRMLSESNPETGTLYYVYDSDSTCGNSSGDLVKKTDAIGNVTCYAHDALHRVTSMTFPSGPDATRTPNKYFVYDSATVNSVAMSNAKTRLAEAYTCTSCPGTKITDVGLSYTARGETSDLYELTPHSTNYFHVSETYWANGAVNTISGLAGVPTITYGVDGEGRTTTASASSGQNPVTGTTYNTASSQTQVTFGSSDSDQFTYDSNTGRMTQYKFNVNGSSVVGNLTWNALGTLGSLGITDPFDSSNAQTCNYAHDDLVRIMTFDCGTGNEGESYTYDPFGNIKKDSSGHTGYNYAPSYSASTNQMGDTGVTYDNNGVVNNGNVTNDGMNSYAWDSNGRPTTINSVGATYDALGNMVEQNRSGSYTQIVYAPDGTKLGLMSGTSTLQKAFVPLTGGAAAVYNPSGLAYYRHSDWVGSSRFASTPSRTMYSDTAYDPFGQPYAQSGTADLSFTGMDQDTSANIYDFPGREYGIQGRWASPDPLGMGAVDRTDPQSWNRYAYVRNSPLSMTDPTGMSGCDGTSATAEDCASEAANCLSEGQGAWCNGGSGCAIYLAPGCSDGGGNDEFDYLQMALTPTGSIPDTSYNCVTEGVCGAGTPIFGNLGLLSQLNTSGRTGGDVADARAEARVLMSMDDCKKFIQKTLDRIAPNAHFTFAQFSAVELNEVVTVSLAPSAQGDTGTLATAHPPEGVTLYPAFNAVPPSVQAAVFIHEAFHLGRFQFSDQQLAKSVFPQFRNLSTSAASALFNQFLLGNCRP